MQITEFLQKNKIIVSGAVGAILVIAVGYWLVFVFLKSEELTTTTSVSTTASATRLLPKNFITVSDLIYKDKIDLKNKDFLQSLFLKNAKDFSQVVPTSTSRGRDNPFLPYDYTGSTR